MRHVYFAFHYQRDIWRVNQVRQSGLVFGSKSVGFVDKSLWEEAKTKGKRALETLIVDGLHGTGVTAVLIGKETAHRPWVQFEIEESLRKGNALVGIKIAHLKDRNGNIDRVGPTPKLLADNKTPIHRWNYDAKEFGRWVEDAYQDQCGERGFWGRLLSSFD